MRKLTSSVVAVMCGSLAWGVWTADANDGPAPGVQIDREGAMAAFVGQNSGVRFFEDGGRITRVYGVPFARGDSPEETAEQFRLRHTEIFGVAAEHLDPRGPLFDERHTQPVMFERDQGSYKFTLVYYTQRVSGLPVFRADLRLLVRNEPGFPLVLASNGLRDLGAFSVGAPADRDPGPGLAAAQAKYPTLDQFSQPELVIWAGVDDMVVQPAVGYRFEGVNTVTGVEAWLFVVDAVTGAILYEEDRIIEIDVTGNVSAIVSQGIGSDVCEDEEIEALPYAQVSIGSTNWYADVNGDFVLADVGTDPVTVESRIRGRWFRIANTSPHPNAVLQQVVTPPATVDFMHNGDNESEFTRAEVNCYVEANVIRDVAIAANPDYPNLNTPPGSPFPVNVNINESCNAFYSPGDQTINFFTSGSNCPNTGNTTVVHHEYAHHLIAMGGSGQGAFGEGMGDSMAVVITDQPLLAPGWNINSCNSFLRNADNTCQYQAAGCSSCGSAIHSCGRLLSGCVWSTRNEFILTEPDDYLEMLRSLTVNSILLHSGSGIAPDITIDWIILDDDDDTIENGSPHYDEIAAGFGAHNMPAPELSLLAFSYPNGQPEFSDPNNGAEVLVEIQSIIGTLDTSQPVLLHVSIDGDPFTAAPMTPGGGNVYTALLPPAPCFATLNWYISAQTTDGDTVTSPSGAPEETFVTSVVTGITTTVSYDFESDPGFSVAGDATDGQWDRGVPIACNRGDPPSDFDGSGQCWLTDNSAAKGCNSDVDGGTTTLITQTLDMSMQDVEFFVSYARWYSNDFGNAPFTDVFVVDISNDSGLTWVELETVGPAGDEVQGGWFHVSYSVNAVIEPTNQMRLRFSASDLGEGSVIEAGIDAMSIEVVTCDEEDTAPPTIAHDAGATTRPFSGYIDPRAESSDGSNVDLGIDSLVIRFNERVEAVGGGPLTPASFTVTGTGAGHPTVISVDDSQNPVIALTLSGHIPIQEWTTVIASVEDLAGNVILDAGDQGPEVNEGDRVDVGYLPADVDQSREVSPFDLLRFRQIVNGDFDPPQGTIEDFVDMDRDGVLAPFDLLVFRQLVNGTGNATRPWAGETMPQRP